MALNSVYSKLPPDPDLVLFAEVILDKIHSKSISVLQRELEKKDLVLSRQLIDGLKRTITHNYQSGLIEAAIEMDLHGRFVDYKTARYIGRPPFDAFKEGILKALNTGKLKPYTIPDYARVSNEATATYIASATVVKYGKQATITRPTTKTNWFKAYFSEILKPMELELADVAAAVALKESERIINHIHGRA